MSDRITFFAVPDWALKGHHKKHGPHKPKEPKRPKSPKSPKPPKGPKPPKSPKAPKFPDIPKPPTPPEPPKLPHTPKAPEFHHEHERERKRKHCSSISLATDSGFDDLDSVYAQVEEYELVTANSDESDEDKEKKKKIIKAIVRAILAYHIIPGGLTAAQLAENTTFATNLSIPATGPLRVRTSKRWSGGITLNFVTRVVKADLQAKNGESSLSLSGFCCIVDNNLNRHHPCR